MKIDVIRNDSKEMVDKLNKLGFDSIFLLEKDRIRRINSDDNSTLSAYGEKDYDFVIRKGKARFIYNLENNLFLLNKGLCSKLKENKMFVMFDLSALIKSDNIFKTYKNLLINGKLCNDYSINCVYASGAEKTSDIKSFFQLVSFANEFGYNYKNMLMSYKALEKFIE